jgi:secreted trypsin-like serine protease
MFALEILSTFSICGATLINSKQVITAAHCVDGQQLHNLRLRAESRDLFRGGRLFDVEKIRIHPKFYSNRMHYDIAILDLKRGTKSIRHADLPEKPMPVLKGEKVVALGWGRTNRSDPNSLSRVLRRATLTVMDYFQCAKLLKGISPAYNFCTETSSTLGTAQGDSGGPALVGDRLVGIIRGGHPTHKEPDLFIVIAAHLPWIHSEKP